MKTLVIMADPKSDSFCSTVTESYLKGAVEKKADVDLINLHQLKFNYNLIDQTEQNSPDNLCLQPEEEDIKRLKDKILWCQNIVFVYPIWFSFPPAIVKAFFDRVFHLGFSYKFRESTGELEHLLKKKRVRVISICHCSPYLSFLMQYNFANIMVKKLFSDLAGFNSVTVNVVNEGSKDHEKSLEGVLYRMYRLGLDDN